MRTAVSRKTPIHPGSRRLLAEAAAWEQGARAEFDALVEFVRAEGVNLGPDHKQQAIDAAHRSITDVARAA